MADLTKPATLSEMVRQLETESSELAREAGEAKATLIVNFGPEGRTIPGLVRPTQTLTAMFVAVFEHLYKDASKSPESDNEKE